MKNLGNTNLNDPEYWDDVYMNEKGSGKRRIDNERWQFLVNGMRDWHQKSPQIEHPEFLDVGCGNGELMRLVHAELPEWHISGIDITPKTLAWAQGVDPQFRYTVATAYDIPLTAEQYHVVFCGETLEHLENPQAAIEQMFKVLAAGGYLVCSLPLNHNNYSPEHLNEFSVWDAIQLTTNGSVDKLVDLDVKVGGLSTIWITKK